MPQDSPFSPANLAKASEGMELEQSPTASQPEGKEFKHFVLPYMVGGQAADIASTASALSSGKFKENNPVLPQNPLEQALIKAAMTGGEGYLFNKMHKTHPKLADALGIVTGSAGLIPAMMNLYHMHSQGK
jgi:hypothetical protein